MRRGQAKEYRAGWAADFPSIVLEICHGGEMEGGKQAKVSGVGDRGRGTLGDSRREDGQHTRAAQWNQDMIKYWEQSCERPATRRDVSLKP